jgi:hypothetical protein
MGVSIRFYAAKTVQPVTICAIMKRRYVVLGGRGHITNAHIGVEWQLFEHIPLKKLGLRVQLNHSFNVVCLLRDYVNDIHTVHLDFCNRHLGSKPPPRQQPTRV